MHYYPFLYQLLSFITISMLNCLEITVTALQTVGEKGWDGFALLRINTENH
ncbi:hypothetical protein XBJ2_1820007 [Xenorhabdus bovienii str. Jollieti]|uniref:Uncharacterized protein n=1 Tax=Xenorhabdus bovienii (strain SS-2004) TaxID=406818 RepID=D3V4P4_XENBS|nr:hypothetical protein XBJ1_3505 [Xenorhabdus bovienii SS-2004]CDH28422.1 hypothetical protein XBJ2_1820007 [Xenorhabdus bovienii str. Jollieti]